MGTAVNLSDFCGVTLGLRTSAYRQAYLLRVRPVLADSASSKPVGETTLSTPSRP
jgi:hypothetical protein